MSTGQITKSKISELSVTRLTGQVSLENNGGFVQMAFDINNDGSIFDASKYEGIELMSQETKKNMTFDCERPT